MVSPGWAWFALFFVAFLAILKAGLRTRWGTALLSVGALALMTGMALYYPLRFLDTDPGVLTMVFVLAAVFIVVGLVLIFRRNHAGVGGGKWDKRAGETRPSWSRDRRRLS